MTKNKIMKSLGDFESCKAKRLPMLDLTRKTQTFSWLNWDLITVYWLHAPEPAQLITAMHARGCKEAEIEWALKTLLPGNPLKLEWIDTRSLAVEIYSFYKDYRARTADPKNKLSGVLTDISAFSGGFTCRREDASECHDFVLGAVNRFIAANPPKAGTWMGDTDDGPVIA